MSTSLVAMGVAALFELGSAPTPQPEPAVVVFIDAAREGGASVARRTVPVVVGDVTSQVSPAHLQNAVSILREYLTRELGAIDWTRRRIKGPYTLVASLLRLESSRNKSGVVSWCTVSTAIHDRKHGLLLTIQGKAQVEGASSAGSSAEQEALAGAVRSSIASLPDAIARAQ